MPELPEVETQRRDLIQAGVIGSRIEAVEVLWGGSIAGSNEAVFRNKLIGAAVTDIFRRGKYLGVRLSGRSSAVLFVHLRMTGSLSLSAALCPIDIHDRVRLLLQPLNQYLVFHDPRKFGKMLITENPDTVTGRLGPEPLDSQLTAEVFHHILSTRKRMLKPLLLDQQVIAGLGNIYADESLFAAGLHPERRSHTLSLEESELLLLSIRKKLQEGIENGGTSLGNGEGNFSSNGAYGRNRSRLQVFRKTGQLCPVCGTPIEKIICSQRSTHFCPHCQKAES